MILAKSTSDIYKFLTEEIDAIQRSNGEILINGQTIANIILQSEWTYFKGRLFINDWEGNFLIIDDKLAIIEKGDKRAFFHVNDDFLGQEYLKDGRLFQSLLADDFTEKYTFKLSKFNNQVAFIDSDFIFLEKKNRISVWEVNTNKVDTLFELSELGIHLDGTLEKQLEVMEFSGVYADILVCSLNSGGVLLFDIKKREVLNYFKDARIRFNLYSTGENTPVFFGLNHTTFIEIDVEKGELIRQINLEKQLKVIKQIPENVPNGVFIDTSVYSDGSIYFKADKNIIGIFDPVEAKIIDHYIFDFEKRGTMLNIGKENLQIKNGEIIVLDSSNTLHVLKKD